MVSLYCYSFGSIEMFRRQMLRGTRFLLVTTLILFAHGALAQRVKVEQNEKPASQKVSILAADKFVLFGDFYQGEKFKGGVLLLHDCNAQRSVYKQQAQLLAAAGLNVLTLDFRGYGESRSVDFSQQKIRKSAKNILAYQTKIAALFSYWASDSLTAFRWLRNKVDNNKQIAIVSSGCSVNYAVAIAEIMHVNSLVMITPQMDHNQKERYKNLADTATYFISSAHQIESYKTAKELFEWSGARGSKMQIFKGSHVGHSLVRHQKGLVNDISQWLCYNLK